MLDSIFDYNGGVLEERLQLCYKIPGESLKWLIFDSIEELKTCLGSIPDSAFIIGEYGVRIRLDINKLLEEVK